MKSDRPLFQEERLGRIRELIMQNGRVTVEELVERFGVSSVTIRKDLALLEESKVVMRTHGGAIQTKQTSNSLPFHTRLKEKSPIKKRIAEAAAAHVTDGEVIFIDASTTVYEMCPFLTGRHGLTVLTTSLSSAYWLATNSMVEVVVVGGTVKRESFGLVGGALEDVARQWRIGKAFMGCWGLTLTEGLTDTPRELVAQKRIVTGYARTVYALADSTKWGQISLESFCRIENTHTIISDPDAPAEMQEQIRALGVKVELS